ncbi:MAG: hypothetical protein U5K69_27190 [Balneolaceae bacterium]|nr:hypothetical protein [Balneolaceae bacterium]
MPRITSSAITWVFPLFSSKDPQSSSRGNHNTDATRAYRQTYLAMAVTVSLPGRPEKSPTPNAARINARNGWSFHRAVPRMMNRTATYHNRIVIRTATASYPWF